jgi:glycosyltransferase involved in cell wall biosynthesis/cellulose synthase/poly-beta-1,6-N-acetylglucosamine synthase-like glycosyltransferase
VSTPVHQTAPPAADFAPVDVVEVEVGEPLPELPVGVGDCGAGYGSALCLIRLHGEPLGMVETALPATPAELAQQIEETLAEAIDAHLEADGLPREALGAAGLPPRGEPRCIAVRAVFLARAPFVSVVIPTRDRPERASAAIESVLACDYPRERFEVILVDNRPDGAGDGAGATAGTLADERVRILHEPVPGGANARNTGLATARGEIVAFTDDDVVADRDWLLTIARAFDGQPGVGAASGLVMPLEMETQAQVWFEGYARFSGRFHRRAYDLGPNRPTDDPLFPFDIGILGTGANMAFRVAALRDAGALDPAFNTKALPNGTDVEALLRVMLRGWTVVHDPSAIVQHAHQREYEQLERRVYGYGLGLTAVFTKSLLHNPSLVPQLLRRVPRGLAFALSPSSAKNAEKDEDFPAELTRLELRGMLRGPLAYARGRREAKRTRRGAKAHAGATAQRPAGDGSLRVLLVTDSYPPLVGGATFWSQQVAHEMSKRGHEVTVVTSWQPGTPALEADGPVCVHRVRDLTSRVPGISADPYRHNPPPFPDPEAVLRLRRLLRRTQPDLVHSYGWLTHSVAAALLGTDVPLLVSTQDYGNVCALRTLFRHGEICSGPAPAKCLECASSNYGVAKGVAATAGIFGSWRLLRRRVTRIHSISRYVAHVIDRDLRAAAPIEIVPNFAEDLEGAPVDESILAQLPDQPFILFVGALRRVKGIAELCSAYEQLDSPPPLVLAGPLAPDTPESFPAGVSVLTSVPHPTVMAMWERALFGVFPSKWPEPLGNVVYEAMSKGRAVIGTRPGGHEDMIEDGRSGLLVGAGEVEELRDAMARLLGDAGLRARLGERARERSREFTAARVMPQLVRLYEETAAVRTGERRA